MDSYGSIHEFNDSQFGRLFASGNVRESARSNMASALEEFGIRGDMSKRRTTLASSSSWATSWRTTSTPGGCTGSSTRRHHRVERGVVCYHTIKYSSLHILI